MEMSSAAADPAPPEGGRVRQRRRTRKAILEAATALMAAGHTPTVAEVADAADVSKRTVYLYFSTQEQLLLDAAVGMLTTAEVDAALQRDGNPADRAATLARALTLISPEVEHAGRALIRLTVGRDDDAARDGRPRRGYRRVEWIEEAVEGAREQLGDAAFERLVTALAMITGFEAVIVQRDLRGLTAAEGAEASAWAARALVNAALAEAEPPPST